MDRRQQLNIPAGQLISGRYMVERTIGTGSMGIVLRCRDRKADGRPVAMKVLFQELAQDEVGMARFRNEIVAAYEVMHRNVVQPFDYIHENGLVAYTMEFVDGTDLAEVLAAKEPINLPTAANWLTQMCRGVHAIHRAGIVHRDLKPENVMLSINGELKIMDFGIARTVGGRKLTAHGALLGTLEYMSPEYLTDGKVHHLGDIYSLGVMGYELLTGRLPHKAGSLLELVKAKIGRPPDPPQMFRPDCPLVLSKMILRAMHTNPAERYQSAQQMYQELESLGYESEYRTPTAEIAKRFLEAQRAADTLAEETDPEPRRRLPESEKEKADWRLIDAAAEAALEGKAPPSGKSKTGSPIFRRLGYIIGGAAVALTGLALWWHFGAGLPALDLSRPPAEPRAAAVPEQLYRALERCDYEQVETLLARWSALNTRNPQGETPLSLAVRNRCLAAANLLIERGADVNFTTGSGATPLQVALDLGFRDLQHLLEHHNAAHAAAPSEGAETSPSPLE